MPYCEARAFADWSGEEEAIVGVDAVWGAFLRLCDQHCDGEPVGSNMVVRVEGGVAVDGVCVGGECIGDGSRESADVNSLGDLVMRDLDAVGELGYKKACIACGQRICMVWDGITEVWDEGSYGEVGRSYKFVAGRSRGGGGREGGPGVSVGDGACGFEDVDGVA